MRFSAQITEVINRNLLVTELLRRNYNVYLPVYDQGIDLIALNEEIGDRRYIQLKGRWTIDKKYIGREIWIAFPELEAWYLAPHDTMVSVGTEIGYCDTKSWKNGGAYSVGSLSAAMTCLMAEWRLGTSLTKPIES